MIELRFQGAEKLLYPAIHPGIPYICSLLFDAQQPKAEAKQPRGKDRFIVRAQRFWFAIVLNGIEQMAQ